MLHFNVVKQSNISKENPCMGIELQLNAIQGCGMKKIFKETYLMKGRGE